MAEQTDLSGPAAYSVALRCLGSLSAPHLAFYAHPTPTRNTIIGSVPADRESRPDSRPLGRQRHTIPQGGEIVYESKLSSGRGRRPVSHPRGPRGFPQPVRRPESPSPSGNRLRRESAPVAPLFGSRGQGFPGIRGKDTPRRLLLLHNERQSVVPFVTVRRTSVPGHRRGQGAFRAGP